jgi:C-terminal processing protease CtpA/Prc
VIVTVTGADVETMVELLLHAMNLDVKSKGKQRLIVASGPESSRSKNIRDREKAYLDRDRIFDHIEGEITKKDDTHFAITRRGLDAALVNVSSVGRTVRLAPEAKDGKAVGFRVLSLRPGSLLARVGLARGDLVMSVNGVDITGPNKALELYTKIRSADDIQFSVLREGKPLALETKVE